MMRTSVIHTARTCGSTRARTFARTTESNCVLPIASYPIGASVALLPGLTVCVNSWCCLCEHDVLLVV